MTCQISGLKADAFTHLFGQDERYLKQHGVMRLKVENAHGYPDRISLRDIPAGETALLINHLYQPARTPYYGSHAIYLWENCTQQGIYINALPPVMTHRLLSLRGFDAQDLLIQADVCEGKAADEMMTHFFSHPTVRYIQVHNARQGCYSCRVDRCE